MKYKVDVEVHNETQILFMLVFKPQKSTFNVTISLQQNAVRA